MDKANNGGNIPERTTIIKNICFCLVKPTYDQCADPIYTQLRYNLPVWNKLRKLWHKPGGCAASCACSMGSNEWFHSISSSEAKLHEGLLCLPVVCPELQVPDNLGHAPKLYKPSCTLGECGSADCLKAKLRKCKIEFADSNERVHYRKYAKMARTRNDGTEYYEARAPHIAHRTPHTTATRAWRCPCSSCCFL